MTWRTMHTSHAHTQASQYLTLLSYWKRHFRRSLSQMISHNDGVWITVTENRHYKFIMTIHRNYYTDLISSYQIADWRHFAKIQPCITGRMLHCCYTNIPGKWSVHNIPPGTGGMSSALLRTPNPIVKSYWTKLGVIEDWKRDVEKRKKIFKTNDMNGNDADSYSQQSMNESL